VWQEGVAHCLYFLSSWFEAVCRLTENATMALKEILENFISYKEHLDELDRNGTESSTVETYEKQFMVR